MFHQKKEDISQSMTQVQHQHQAHSALELHQSQVSQMCLVYQHQLEVIIHIKDKETRLVFQWVLLNQMLALSDLREPVLLKFQNQTNLIERELKKSQYQRLMKNQLWVLSQIKTSSYQMQLKIFWPHQSFQAVVIKTI